MEDLTFKVHWHKLNSFVGEINSKVKDLLEFHENDFLKAFKHQMYKLQEELSFLKRNMDERILREKKNKKILVLQKHLEYFRCQAVRLERERNGFIKTIDDLKRQLKASECDKKYFERFVIESRKENQMLRDSLKEMEEEHKGHLEELGKLNGNKMAQMFKKVDGVQPYSRHRHQRKDSLPKALKVVNRAYGKRRVK